MDGCDVGVIILAEKDGRRILGSIENPTCRIWIQRTRRRRSSRGRATVRRRKRRKEAERQRVRGGGRSERGIRVGGGGTVRGEGEDDGKKALHWQG